MKFLLLSIFVCSFLETVTSSFCYWNSGCPYKYFSSKTPYNNVRGDIRDSLVKLKDCEPISVWGLLSNGKSNPGEAFARSIKEAFNIRNDVIISYTNGESSLCAQDIENLQEWVIDGKTLNTSNALTEEGYDELMEIGKRLEQTFPKLFTNLKEGRYTFRPAFGSQAEESAKSFVKGLENKKLVIEKSKSEYDIMAPYLTCKKYESDAKQNPKLFDEATKYLSTTDYLSTKDRMQRRLGLRYKLSDENVQSLYDLCRYTWSGVENKFSPWCALFTTEDLRVLEYIDDLKHYYKNGYGTPINELLGRIPMADLFKSFQEVKDGKGKNVVVYFTDTTMLNMVCTALDLLKDENPLTGASRNPKRKWRTSKLSVFSANLFVVLNRCTKSGENDHNVVFYWNEEPLLPICERGFCSWTEFENKLAPFVNTTTEFCEAK